MSKPSMPIRFLVVFLLVSGITIPLFARTIDFAGRSWTVRSGFGGPGDNYWSDSEQSVWVDSEGLHLKIRKDGQTWYCSEVISVEATPFGMHRFYVASRVDQLDENVVAAPFLYKDDNHEIDIEFSKWGSDWPLADNAQFAVQHNSGGGADVHSFYMSLNGDYSTHYINWQYDSILFKSFHGHYTEPPDPGYLIEEWTYTGSNNPSEWDELHVHINLWLIDHVPPSDEQEVEFIVKNADLPDCLTPASPSYVSPPDGATNESQPVYLDWSFVGVVDNFQIQVDDNNNFASPEIDDQTSSSYYYASGLAHGTTYYWRVRAHNYCGWGSWSPPGRDFTTEFPTSIGKIGSPDVPKSFALDQNHPNPFNPQTRIGFSIPQPSFVTIEIFDSLGRRIRNLVNGPQSAGYKVVTWDGKDDEGHTVASGVYLYRISAGQFTAAKKMLLLK